MLTRYLELCIIFQVRHKYYKSRCIDIKIVIFSVKNKKISKFLISSLACLLSIHSSKCTTYYDEGERNLEYIDGIGWSYESSAEVLSSDKQEETKSEETKSSKFENKKEAADIGKKIKSSNISDKSAVLSNSKKSSSTKTSNSKTEKDKSANVKKSKNSKDQKDKKLQKQEVNDKNTEKKKNKKIDKKHKSAKEENKKSGSEKSSSNTKTITYNGKTYKILKTVTGTATYYSDSGATSTGVQTRAGVMAVNPEIISYHSHLLVDYGNGKYEEGYALDTGGALKKHHKNVVVDIFKGSESLCKALGRKKVKVYILSDIK